MQTMTLKKKPDYIAPDGSKIYLVSETKQGGLCLCELPEGAVSKAVCHKTVDEIWFFISGEGQVWRKAQGEKNERIVRIHNNIALTITAGCHFQFKNTGEEPFRFLITTMPPWPGENEAFSVKGHWK